MANQHASPPYFVDRVDAGQQLAEALQAADILVDIVLAIPRGGLPLGRAVADALSVPLDIVVTSKLGAPHNPELAIGAVGSDGSVWLDEEHLDVLGVSEEYVERERSRKVEAAREKATQYRRGEPPDLSGKHVVIVDDGLATGSTMRAAVELVRGKGATSVVVAVPVGPPETVQMIEAVADDVVCLRTPSTFGAVGRFYRDFDQVTDEQAIAYLRGNTEV